MLLADTILSLGGELFSEQIASVSGGRYSHAAVADGEDVIEATLPTVRCVNVADFAAKCRYVDVYRHVEGNGREAAILASAGRYLSRRYNSFDLVIAIAVATFTAWLKAPIPWAAWNVHYDAGRVGSFLGTVRALRRAAASGSKQVTCAELVARSHLESGLGIRVRLSPGNDVDFGKLWDAILALLAYASESRSPHESGAVQEDLVAGLRGDFEWLKGLDAALRRARALELSVPFLKELEVEVGSEWDPEFLTPHQLATSPSFRFLGELRPTPGKDGRTASWGSAHWVHW